MFRHLLVFGLYFSQKFVFALYQATSGKKRESFRLLKEYTTFSAIQTFFTAKVFLDEESEYCKILGYFVFF